MSPPTASPIASHALDESQLLRRRRILVSDVAGSQQSFRGIDVPQAGRR
jgi:hypothetical protein